MFCLNCGKQIDDDSEFCCFCGEKVQRIKTQPQQKEEPKIESKRNVVYEGNIHKCPNCGEVLKSFEATCPSCGFEFRNTNNHSKKIEESIGNTSIPSGIRIPRPQGGRWGTLLEKSSYYL